MPLYFAARLAQSAEMHRRRPRAEQSRDAEALLGDLRRASRLAEGPSSKSHCRALSAAALADHGRVGVDAEWIGAAKHRSALARFLLEADENGDVWALYRAWTFREAYFKAFGAFPNVEKRRAIYTAPPIWDAPMQQDGYAVLFRRLEGDFVLCALWDAGDEFSEMQL